MTYNKLKMLNFNAITEVSTHLKDLDSSQRLMRETDYFIGNYGSDAIVEASSQGRLDVVELLYERCSFASDILNKATNKAVEGNHLEVVKYLVCINNQCIISNNAIDKACINGWVEMTKYLYNILYYDNNTFILEVLQLASEGGHLEIVKYLFENTKFSDIDACYRSLDRSAYLGHFEIVKFLCEKGVTVTSDTMECAVDGNHSSIISYLENKIVYEE